MRTITLLTVALTLLGATLLAPAIPAAPPEPQCVQVYPWSQLCEGDVEGFVGYFTDNIECSNCALPVPTVPEPPHVDCIQVIPWSYLCSGRPDKFVDYYVNQFGPILG